MLGVMLHIEKAKASGPLDGFIPNPKLKLLDQLSEVMRFKHLFHSDGEDLPGVDYS
jgi:hypothetical protein